MTYEEVKQLLVALRMAKKCVNIQQRRLLEMKEQYETIKSCLCMTSNKTARTESPVEKVILRLERTQDEIAEAMERMFALEDQFMDAANDLDPMERDVLLEFYMADKRLWEIGDFYGVSEKTIARCKIRAMRKISEKKFK